MFTRKLIKINMKYASHKSKQSSSGHLPGYWQRGAQARRALEGISVGLQLGLKGFLEGFLHLGIHKV